MIRMEVGRYNRLPHYAVVGEPADFYVWVNETGEPFVHKLQGHSHWIKGRSDIYFKLKRSLRDKEEFTKQIKELRAQYDSGKEAQQEGKRPSS